MELKKRIFPKLPEPQHRKGLSKICIVSNIFVEIVNQGQKLWSWCLVKRILEQPRLIWTSIVK